MKPNKTAPNETSSSISEKYPSLDALDAAITPQVEEDSSVDLIKRAQAKGESIIFDFDEDEFTRTHPSWKSK